VVYDGHITQKHTHFSENNQEIGAGLPGPETDGKIYISLRECHTHGITSQKTSIDKHKTFFLVIIKVV
jgi:hypothetical protein